MSDLRDRLAAVLGKHAADEYSWGVDGCTCGADTQDKQAQHQADAVIAELGLRQEIKEAVKTPPKLTFTRYVTDWEATTTPPGYWYDKDEGRQ
jgi:hypothetical protein